VKNFGHLLFFVLKKQNVTAAISPRGEIAAVTGVNALKDAVFFLL
jgi:hypothetical protein